MKSALEVAKEAARKAGELLREHFGRPLDVDEAMHHDIKLALDKKSQDVIFDTIKKHFPEHALYGEEGIGGNQNSEWQWIVDPIDGTVNFFYGIPHFCISIALRKEQDIIMGIIYDPMLDEMFAVEAGQAPTLNGQAIESSSRTKLEESILFVGCGKDQAAMDTGLERFRRASIRARKMRMMGSAALAMAYVACGRLDAYVESRISLWDIAAGKLLLEAANGSVDLEPRVDTPDVWSIVATNGKIPIEEIL